MLGSGADVSMVLKWTPQILVSSNMTQLLEKKIKHLTSFGLLEDEIMEGFVDRKSVV